MPPDGAIGTLTLLDGGLGTYDSHGLIHMFVDDYGVTRWEIQVDHQIIDDTRVTAIGFQEPDVVNFVED